MVVGQSWRPGTYLLEKRKELISDRPGLKSQLRYLPAVKFYTIFLMNQGFKIIVPIIDFSENYEKA